MDDTTRKDLLARLAAAKASKRSFEANRSKRQAEELLLAEVEAAEIAARDSEAISKAEAEHGATRIGVLPTDFGCVILKRPNSMLYKRFRDKESHKTADFERLVRPCVVYPDSAGFDRILDDAPATLDRCANVVVDLAGFRIDEVSKK